MPSNTNTDVRLSAEVEAALREGQPVVALESTIVCHGMPFPQNIETAFEMQAAIRETGAVPAMVAVDRGALAAGLTDTDIERFGRDGADIVKASRRDLPFLMADAADGATTVAATMWIAARAGISIFATGGIGGVHRGVEATMDVSADLEELAQTNVAVVCAGVKSVLDIPRTLEYLETRGVPVIGYGTDTLPAFYTTTSGLPVDRRIDSPDAVASVMSSKWAAGLRGGLVVAVPVPREEALNAREMDRVITEALAEMDAAGISGKHATPFLLGRIADRTEGKSLRANIALAVNNARVAAAIAKSYAQRRPDP
ncbi:MAG: pseudouridine-5'-phosphate glycosidase [Pseudomonadota bacterium]